MSRITRVDEPHEESTTSAEGEAQVAWGFGEWIDRFLPRSVRHSEPLARSRARVLVCLMLIVFGITVVMVVGKTIQGAPAVAGLGWIFLAMATALLVGLRAGIPIEHCATATMGLIYAASVGLTFFSGGEAVPAVMLTSLIPLIAYGIRGRTATIRWGTAALVGVGATALYAASTDAFPYHGVMLAWEQWRFISFACMVLFVLFAALGLDWIVERARAETDQVYEQMQRQGARYRDLVENVGDAMMEYDAESRCIYASQNWFELLGRKPEELLGYGYVEVANFDDVEELSRVKDELVAHPGRTSKFSTRIRHAAGHWVHGEASARAFYDDKGQLHIVTIFRDLSELYRAQLAMRHSDRLASAGTLAAGIAHQINNPIGSIRTASEYALRCAQDGDLSEIEDVLRSNIDQSARCGEIVRSLLQFAAREHPEKAVGDLRDVVERAFSLAQSYGHERGVELSLALSDDPLLVRMSPIEIEQVLVNLFRNAIESVPESRRVEVLVERLGEAAVVEVRDDGRGISEGDLPQVFDPFFTTRLEDGGSGLGLSVALGIARDHEGTLDIETTEGEGTCVSVTLPLTG